MEGSVKEEESFEVRVLGFGLEVRERWIGRETGGGVGGGGRRSFEDLGEIEEAMAAMD